MKFKTDVPVPEALVGDCLMVSARKALLYIEAELNVAEARALRDYLNAVLPDVKTKELPVL